MSLTVTKPTELDHEASGRKPRGSLLRARALLRALPGLPVMVTVVALLEVALHLFFARRAPRSEAWARARPIISSWYKPGDLVSVAPYWAEPMGRQGFGDPFMPLRDVARPDASRYARAIEVSAMGARDPELTGWAVDRKVDVGALTLRLLRPPTPPNVRYVFADHFEPPSVEVSIAGSGHGSTCSYTTTAAVQTGNLSGNPTFPAARFGCSGRGEQFAGITIIDDERNRPRQCIWTFAPGGPQEMVVRFVDVPLGDVIQGHTGTHWMYDRDASSSFVMRVLVDDQEVGRVMHQDAMNGWTPFRLVLKSSDAGRTANVEFRVGATNAHPACFEADTR